MRRSTAALLVIAAVPAFLVVPTLGPTAAEPHPVAPRLATLAIGGVDAAALQREQTAPAAADPDVPAQARSPRPAVFTAPTGTADFSLVGVTWDADQPTDVASDDLTVTVRTHSGGRWQPWAVLPTDSGDGPSGDEGATTASGVDGASGATRVGTSPYYSGPSDGIQVRVDTEQVLPVGLRVDLVDPGTSAADTRLVAMVPSAAQAASGMPAVVTRKQWGADESLRNGSATYEPSVKVAFVHHTATSSSYTKDQAAAAVRSIYAYDTKSLGWSDIAYNVLVDKYGQVFEGRAGGLDKAVRSAATGGFNAQSWSVSALGNYQDSAPTSALVSSISKVLAWKLGVEHLNPKGTATLTASDGSGTTAKYANGTKVTFPVISGHRDAGSTACPGTLLYAKLPSIRTSVASLMGAGLYSASASPRLVPKGEKTPVRVKARVLTAQSWRLEVKKQGTSTVLRTYEGTAAADGLVDVSWDLEDSDGDTVKEGTYTLTLQSWSGSSVAVPYAVNVGLFADPDVYDRPADGVFHLEGRGYGHGHGMSQFGAEGAARKGLTRNEILAFYYPGTALATAPATQTIRVSLSSAVRTTAAGKDVRLRAAAGLRVSETGRHLVLPPTLGGKTVTVWRVFFSDADATVGLYGWTGGSYQPVPGWTGRPGPLRFTTAAAATTTSRVTLHRTTGADVVYRGVLEVRPNSARTGISALSEVLLDDYVKSVVSAEMPGGWTATAYQAQAVAARSYAMFKRAAAVAAGNTAHICDTTSCQVYNGYSGETSEESKAATATAGLYLTYGGAPIFAEFGSANGGYSAAGGKPYLVAKADPYDGVVTGTANWGHAWTKDVPASTIQAAYPALGTIERIVVVDRDGRGDWGGRVTSVRLEGSKSDVTVSGTALRSTLGLKSEWFRAQQIAPAPPPVVVPTQPPSTGAPSAVGSLTAVSADRSARLSWTAPTKSGSSAITGFRITVSPGGRVVDVDAAARTATVGSLVNGRSYSFSVVARNGSGSSTAAKAAAVPTSAFGYPMALAPTSVWTGSLTPTRSTSIKVLGVGGVPTKDVSSVTVRVQASSSIGSLVTVGPGGSALSSAQLTVPRNGTATNLLVVPVGSGGTLSVQASASTAVTLEVVGYDTKAGGVGSRFVAVEPTRLGTGTTGGPISLTVPVVGQGGVPTKTAAALVQLSVSAGAAPVTVRLSPDGTLARATTAVTVAGGGTRTVPVLAPVGKDGTVRVLSTAPGASVAVDLYGYYVTDDGLTAAGRTRTLTPTRIFDSRTAPGGKQPGAKSLLTIPVLGRGGVPSGAVSAVILNVIAYAPTSSGTMRVFPAGTAVPGVRALSFDSSSTVRTTVIVKVGSGGAVQAYLPTGGAHVVVDVAGYVTG